MSNLDKMCKSKILITTIIKTWEIYMLHGARSSKKVDYFHSKIKSELETLFTSDNGYKIELEYNISSTNSSGKKKCDIVILKYGKPYIIFPVKIIMSNYKQNKNNAWENLTGEVSHIKWKNPHIYIIPINIFMNKTVYLKNNKIINKFEHITHLDIQIYSQLVNNALCFDIINYIIDVQHVCNINEPFSKVPTVSSFNQFTPFRTFYEILTQII